MNNTLAVLMLICGLALLALDHSYPALNDTEQHLQTVTWLKSLSPGQTTPCYDAAAYTIAGQWSIVEDYPTATLDCSRELVRVASLK